MLEAERAAVGKAQKPFVELKEVHCGWGLQSERLRLTHIILWQPS